MDMSILTEVKESVGVSEDCTDFDKEILAYINSTMLVLHQLGVGPSDGFVVEDKESKWSDFVNDKRVLYVKEYVFLNVKLRFDTKNTNLQGSIERRLNELTWRLSNNIGSNDNFVDWLS